LADWDLSVQTDAPEKKLPPGQRLDPMIRDGEVEA